MGKSTIVYKGPDFGQTPYKIFGFNSGSTSGTVVTSGWTSSGMVRAVVSGYDEYSFVLLASGKTIPGTSFNGATTQIATIIFGTTG